MSNIDLDIRVRDKTASALGNIDKRIKGLDGSVKSLNSRSGLLVKTLVGLGTGLVARNIVQTTARFEDLRTSLSSVTGSAKEGAEAFDFISRFSTKTQFGVEELSETFIKLKASGIEPTEKLLTTFTDTAAVTTDQLGSLTAITDLLARTTSGGLGLEELNRLADRGIPVFRILEEQLGITRLQISEYGKTAEGAAKITDALLNGLDKSFAGATAARAQNLSTRISNLQIALANAADSLGQGFNEALGETIVDLTEFIEKNDDLIKQLGADLGVGIEKTAEAIKGLRDEFIFVKDTVGTIIDGFNALPPYVKEAGLITALLLGKKGIAVLAAISFAIGKIKGAIDGVMDTDFTVDPGLEGQDRIDALNDRLALTKLRIAEIDDALEGGMVVNPISGVEMDIGDEFRLELMDEQNALIRTQRKLTEELITAQMGSAFAHGELDKAQKPVIENQIKLGELTEITIKDMPISTKMYDEAIEAYDKMAESSKAMIKVPVGTAAEENRKEYEKFVKRIKDTERAMILLNPQIENERILLEKLKETVPGLTESLSILDEELEDIFTQESPFFAFGEHIKEQGDAIKQLGSLSSQVYDRMANDITNFVMTGKFNFASFSRFVIQELIKIAVQAALTFAIKSIAGSFGFAIPGLADGGPVRAGRPYIVGEEGPELFVPNASGKIVPNGGMQSVESTLTSDGSDGVIVNFNINTVDATGFDELLVARRSTIVGIINEGLNRQGKKALI